MEAVEEWGKASRCRRFLVSRGWALLGGGSEAGAIGAGWVGVSVGGQSSTQGVVIGEEGGGEDTVKWPGALVTVRRGKRVGAPGW